MMALAVAKKLNGVVRTSWPAPTPAAARLSQIASVPEAHPIACPTPINAAASCSNSITAGPRMYCCEAQTCSIASDISSWIAAYCRDRSSMGTDADFADLTKVFIRAGAAVFILNLRPELQSLNAALLRVQ